MCGRPHGAAVRRARWPTNEYEYDGVWNEACVRELSIFPTTTGAPPHEFHTYLNQQDEVLVAQLPHELAGFFVTHGQVGHLEATPASLALCERQIAGGAHNLAHARMSEQVGVYGRRFTGPAVTGGATGQDADSSSP